MARREKDMADITRMGAAELKALMARCPWFVPARVLAARAEGREDRRLAALAPWRAECGVEAGAIDVGALLALSSDDIIDRFLLEEDLRIVAEEEGPECEVRVEAELDDDDDLVSEELAEIYIAQGLNDRAMDIYRKLSLRNSEKSVYFAELIGRLENK